jgi:hypothetical protein
MGVVNVHAATRIGTGAAFEDARSKVHHVLPLYRVAYTSSYTTGPDHPSHAAMKRMYSDSSTWARDEATDTYTLTMKRTARVCVQVRDVVLMFHKSGLELRGETPASTRALAKALAKMASSAGETPPNFSRIVTINGRKGGVGAMTLHEYLEQMVVVQVGTGSRDTLGTALDRLIQTGGQYVTKYLYDTYSVVHHGEADDDVDVEAEAEAGGGPIPVSEWVRRHLAAGMLEPADADRARHFLNKQRGTTAAFKTRKHRPRKPWRTDTPPTDAAESSSPPTPAPQPQMVKFKHAWYEHVHDKVVFPSKCRPMDMGAVAAGRWTLANTLQTLEEFASRMVLQQKPAMKRVFDVEYTSDSMQRSFTSTANEKKRDKACRRSEKLDKARHALREAYEDY